MANTYAHPYSNLKNTLLSYQEFTTRKGALSSPYFAFAIPSNSSVSETYTFLGKRNLTWGTTSITDRLWYTQGQSEPIPIPKPITPLDQIPQNPPQAIPTPRPVVPLDQIRPVPPSSNWGDYVLPRGELTDEARRKYLAEERLRQLRRAIRESAKKYVRPFVKSLARFARAFGVLVLFDAVSRCEDIGCALKAVAKMVVTIVVQRLAQRIIGILPMVMAFIAQFLFVIWWFCGRPYSPNRCPEVPDGSCGEAPNQDSPVAMASLSRFGTSWGDPHITTIDGLDYDFHGVGEFVLIESIIDQFVVQVRQEPTAYTRFSENTAVAIAIDGVRIGIYARYLHQPITLNGNVYNEKGEFSHNFESGISIGYEEDRFEATWRDGSKIIVRVFETYLDIRLALSSQRSGAVRGLLGNFDGQPENDLSFPDGRAAYLSQMKTFANSWRITQDESLFVYAPGESTETFTDVDFPDSFASSTLSAFSQRTLENQSTAQIICFRYVVPYGPRFEGCVNDVAATMNIFLPDDQDSDYALGAKEAADFLDEQKSVPMSCSDYAEVTVLQNEIATRMDCDVEIIDWTTNVGASEHLESCQNSGLAASNRQYSSRQINLNQCAADPPINCVCRADNGRGEILWTRRLPRSQCDPGSLCNRYGPPD